MGQLTGNQIDLSYQGLIKTTDNAALGAVEKEITDGVGTASTLKLGTTSASFVGTLDLTGATVLGGGGAAGLVSGTGTDSMKSADTLTPLSTNLAGGQNAIVFGAGAIGNQDYGITIGTSAQSGIFSTAVGTYAEASGLYATGVGPSCKATGQNTVSVGKTSWAQSESSVAIGESAHANGTYGAGSVCIGLNTRLVRDAGVAVGRNLNLPLGDFDHYRAVAIGSGTNVRGGDGIGIGTNVDIQGPNTNDKIAIGNAAVVTDDNGAVALGAGVTASTANTVTIKKLQMLDYASLSFADDTAAAAGGIPLGGVYHTSGALKIRIA